MKLKKNLQLALNALIHSQLRSWLTILGIVIGIAAVVAIVSMSQGAQKNLEAQLGSFGADILTVSPGYSRAGGSSGGFRDNGGFNEISSASLANNLTSKDIIILKNILNVKSVSGIISGRVDMTYISKTASINLRGVDQGTWKDVVSTDLESGRYLSNGDTNVVVVGGRIAHSVFDEIVINRQVVIKGKVFKVVGILKESGNNDDSVVFMPLIQARDVLDNPNGKQFDTISIKVSDTTLINDTMNLIDKQLMLSRGILKDSDKDFTVTSPVAFQERISSTLNSMSLFLAVIAAISLLVGAVGISNTMFTSVLEKTKEIGIMKAIGAKNRDILLIFLFKSGMLGLIGGVGGIILGVLSSGLLGSLIGVSFGRISFSFSYVSLPVVFGAFFVSIIIGMLAGIIPAYRASKLKPVDALRYE